MSKGALFGLGRKKKRDESAESPTAKTTGKKSRKSSSPNRNAANPAKQDAGRTPRQPGKLRLRIGKLRSDAVRFVKRRPGDEFAPARFFELPDDVDSQVEEAEVSRKRRGLRAPSFHLPRDIGNTLRKRKATLSVENGVVRVVLFQGGETIAWGTSLPGDETQAATMDTGAIRDPRSVATHPLLMDPANKRMRLVTELPLYGSLLRRIHLPAIQKSYYEEVVLAEVLDTVPFEKEDLDISWQWGPIGKESEVFAAAVPKQTVDAHVRVLNRASFSPSASYPRAVALAAAARVPAAILAHVADDRATLVVVRDWLPGSVLDYHLAERGTPEDLAAQLAEAAAKIAGYDHTLTGDERGSELPVILTGTIDDVERVSREFARLSGRTLLPFEPDLKYPEHFPPAEYAVNIGLAIADRNRGKPGAKLTEEQVPALNMLSERHLPKPIPFRPIAIFMSLMLFGVVAFNLTPQVEAQVVEATVIGERLDNLEKQARTRRLSVSAARDLEERTEALRTKVTLLDVRLDDFAFELDAVLKQLEAITGLAEAQGVRISSIQLSGEEYILSGSAGSYDGVLAYTASLREAGDGVFTSVRVLRAASTAAAELLAGFEGAGAEANVGFQATAKFNRSDFLLPVEDESVEIVPPTRNSIQR